MVVLDDDAGVASIGETVFRVAQLLPLLTFAETAVADVPLLLLALMLSTQGDEQQQGDRGRQLHRLHSR